VKLSDAQIRKATAHTMCPGCGHLIENAPDGGVMCTNTACPAWRRVLREPEPPGRSPFNNGMDAIEPVVDRAVVSAVPSSPTGVMAFECPECGQVAKSDPTRLFLFIVCQNAKCRMTWRLPRTTPTYRVTANTRVLVTSPRHEPSDAERATERLAASPPSWASPLGWRLAVMAEAEWYAKRFGGRLARGKREVSTLRRVVGLPAGAQYRGEDSDFYRTLRVYHRCRLEGMPHDAAKEVAAEEMWLLDKGFIDQYARGLEKPAQRLQRPRANDGRRTFTCRLVGDGNDTYR